MNLKKKNNCYQLTFKVTPNSSKNALEKDADGNLRLRLAAPPVDGKANKACIAFFSKTFKIPKSSIKIVKGETSRYKTILFDGYYEKDIAIIIDRIIA